MEDIKDNRQVNSQQAWAKLYARLQDENLVPVQEAKAKNNLLYYGLRIAALVVILLGAGLAIYLNLDRENQSGLAKVNPAREGITFVKTLSDGSVIYVAQNSLFDYPEEFKSASRNVELKGEAFFDVVPDPSKPFIIETDEARIQVLGTAFNVKTNDGTGFELSVERGTVKVTLKNNPKHSELVMAGEKISTLANSLVKSKNVSGGSGAWYTRRMHFKDENLKDIISVLNRNFNTNFVLANNEIGKRKLTVTFQNETAGTMTELICAALNLKSQTINGSVVLSGIKEGAKQN